MATGPNQQDSQAHKMNIQLTTFTHQCRRVPPCSQTVALLIERCTQVMWSYTIGNKSSMQKEQTGWVI